MKKRFFYISNTFEDSLKKFRLISGDSPAASSKVIRICQAVKEQGANVIIISLGRKRQANSWKWYPAKVIRSGNIAFVYAAYFDAPILTHLISTYSLLLIILRFSNKKSVLIFYNYLLYYIPTLIVNKILGRKCLLDLEDGFRQDEKTLKSRINFVSLKIHNLFCNNGVMVASEALLTQTNIKPATVCYGVAPQIYTNKDWSAYPLHILYGGALLRDTGAEIFLDALEILFIKGKNISGKIKFIVTGFGDMSEQIKQITQTKFGSFVEFRGNVSSAEYIEILKKCQIGLALKIPSMSMGMTTFPSKVIEMAAYGLLIVSTKVSDIPKVFSDKTAVLLSVTTPIVLAEAINDILYAPLQYHELAIRGQHMIRTSLSPEKIGKDLIEFWSGIKVTDNVDNKTV